MDRRLAEARAKARLHGMDAASLRVSARQGKRFSIRTPSGATVHFGSWPAQTYLDHGDERERQAWQARHSTIMRRGRPAFQDPESPEHYSWHVLW